MRRAARIDAITLTLPYPPSVNHYWRRNKGAGMHISAEGVAYQNAVVTACDGLPCVFGRVRVHVIATMPDKRKRDLDNLLKSLLDALNHAGMYEDDSHIDDLQIVRNRGVVRKGGSVVVEIEAIA
jgi:crossover junction endodeoxyribonuclease RusA